MKTLGFISNSKLAETESSGEVFTTKIEKVEKNELFKQNYSISRDTI